MKFTVEKLDDSEDQFAAKAKYDNFFFNREPTRKEDMIEELRSQKSSIASDDEWRQN